MTHLKYLWRTLLVKFENSSAGMQFWNNLITGGTRVLAFHEMFFDLYSFVNRLYFLWGRDRYRYVTFSSVALL